MKIEGDNQASAVKTGEATFSLQGGAGFRYKLTDSRIWLENQKTKHQWDCVIADVDDYAVDTVKIPALVVKKSLARALAMKDGAGTDSVKVGLLDSTEKGELCLELLLSFRTANVTWRAKYAFPMSPIAMSETDILSAQVRDMQEEMDALRSELAVVTKSHETILDMLPAMPMLEHVRTMVAHWAKQAGRGLLRACEAGWKVLFERPTQIGQR